MSLLSWFSFEEGEQYAKTHGLLFLEASAKSGENVEEAFMTTAVQVLERIRNGVFDLKDEVSYLFFIVMLFLTISIVMLVPWNKSRNEIVSKEK